MSWFNSVKFLGASVRSLGASLSWGMGQPSEMRVGLAIDPLDNDAFQGNASTMGLPCGFSLGGFRFEGILQKIEHRQGTEGDLLEAVVIDPRELLEAPVVVGAYSGSVAATKNVFNAFGYWESQGFGLSQANESGMPASKVFQAVLALCNQPYDTPYGGPITYRGVKYGLDLRELPVLPEYYRIGGNYLSLLELIARACEDGGHDFFVELRGRTITLRTVSRRSAPPLGTLEAASQARRGIDQARNSYGLEVRNEVTSAFLVGGEVSTLYLQTDVRSFWGYDFSGNPILGTPGVFDIFQAQQGQRNPPRNRLLLSVPVEYMDLNASPVADILGRLSYLCSTLELRMAKISYDSWSVFVQHCRKDIADRIGLVSTFQQLGGGVNRVFRQQVVNDGRADALAQSRFAMANDRYAKSMRMYEFVKGYADDYMGKKFVVGLPFLLHKQDNETLRVSTSWEITDGGYLEEGSAPLGLSPLNEDVFKTQDGRFRAFVKYADLTKVDMSLISPQGTVIQDDGLFVECQVDPNIIYAPGPAAVVTVQGPLFEEPQDMVGNAAIVAAVLQTDPNNRRAREDLISRAQFGSVGVKAHPSHKTPAFVAIPLRSNIMTYGPWYAVGAPGKVRYEQDPSLVPWNYGGYELLDQVGRARVAEVLSNMQLSEQGTCELAGIPTASLGDVLDAGGPNITNIQINFSPQGATTTYSFRTFTPRFGTFSKAAIEKAKKAALTAVELRKALRASIRQAEAKAQTVTSAVRAAAVFANAPRQVRRQSPHDVLTGYTAYDTTQDGRTVVRIGVADATYEEAIAFSAFPEEDEPSGFAGAAAVGWAGLFRPFATGGSGDAMPSYATPASGFTTGLCRTTLDPYKAHNDIEVYLWGSTYEGMNAYVRSGDYATARPLCLRGPLVMAGWGYDSDGKPVPADASGNFVADHLLRYDLWKVGPIDHYWDARRGVWTSNNIARGRTAQSIAGNLGNGKVVVHSTSSASGATSWELTAYNWGETAVPSGANVMLGFEPNDRRWYVLCPWASGTPVTSGSVAIPPTGLTTTITYVSDAYCSGSTFVKVTRNMQFVSGVLVREYS
jgi:hypothetical protein